MSSIGIIGRAFVDRMLGSPPVAASTAATIEVAHVSPQQLLLSHSKFNAAQAYGRGPGSLVYSQRKRLGIVVALLLVLTSCIVLTTLCLFRGQCSASDLDNRAIYSRSASNGVVPSCLALLFIAVPLSLVALHLGWPVLALSAFSAEGLASILLLATCIGSFAVAGRSDSIATALWPTLAPSLRSAGYHDDVSQLSAQIGADAIAVALSALAALVCTALLTLLHGSAVSRFRALRRASRAALLAGGPGGAAAAAAAAASAGVSLPLPLQSLQARIAGGGGSRIGPAWCRPLPAASEEDTQYSQLLTRRQWAFCCGQRPTAAVSVPDCCGICSIAAVEVDSWRLLCCCCPARPPPQPMPYPSGFAPATGLSIAAAAAGIAQLPLAQPAVPAVLPPAPVAAAIPVASEAAPPAPTQPVADSAAAPPGAAELPVPDVAPPQTPTRLQDAQAGEPAADGAGAVVAAAAPADSISGNVESKEPA